MLPAAYQCNSLLLTRWLTSTETDSTARWATSLGWALCDLAVLNKTWKSTCSNTGRMGSSSVQPWEHVVDLLLFSAAPSFLRETGRVQPGGKSRPQRISFGVGHFKWTKEIISHDSGWDQSTALYSSDTLYDIDNKTGSRCSSLLKHANIIRNIVFKEQRDLVQLIGWYLILLTLLVS